jgi:hypothetical protein
MSGWFRALFLTSSFAPLYAMLAAELYVQREHVGWAWTAFLACFVSSILIFLQLQGGFKSKSPFHSIASKPEALDEGILTYIISYIPPLLVDDFSKAEKLVPAVAFYFVLAILMWHVDTIHVNPLFLVFRYRIYRVELESGRSAVIITRKEEIVGAERLSLFEIQPSRLYFAE